MAKQFFVLSAVIFACLVSLTVLAIFFGKFQPKTRDLSVLGVIPCNQNLCSRKLTLGTTQWSEAKAILASNFGYSMANGNINFFDGSVLSLYRASASGAVSVEFETVDGTFFTVGDLIVNYGNPCSIKPADDIVYLEYPQFIAEIPYGIPSSRGGRLAPQFPITDVQIPGQEQACQKPLTIESFQNISAKWCGFTYVIRCRN